MLFIETQDFYNVNPGVFTVNFERISRLFQVFLCLTLCLCLLVLSPQNYEIYAYVKYKNALLRG